MDIFSIAQIFKK